MKKLLTIAIAVLAIAITGSAIAKKPAQVVTPAGPNPLIDISTDCVKSTNGDWVNKFFAGDVPPNEKNENLASAISKADQQTTPGDPDVLKSMCEVTRTTPSGVVQLVYVAYAPED